mmetsp:Transcript_54713/g.132852  ORF Transcript_54713/g.132852 Transcript_54713/m.132852 type:complete len:369 (-) Transcript_54713:878-1984(-)|eukprot:CAMPEP_0113510074 /NCGR_PEP_ID=MMETSP0014_2-20120614/37928_1 /TAXON_ID=2857 /ORGANISM="Nitzschia sp." /LENGTH=368 /DNA_ID=CAMNT_0000405973 /DNA_START=198 /DNA_END=1304 /DNA_ORIENTATION=+ /assembly_acc=CAM_ASM_000159
MSSPLFHSTSNEEPKLLTISFKDDPNGSLGAQLINCDKGEPFEMFSPGYAQVGRLLDGETVAKKANVRVGDVIVAVNGHGFRRFAPDFKESEVENLSKDDEDSVKNDNHVLHMGKGEAYDALLTKIKTVKSAGSPPLVLGLERYSWDAKVNSWPRFLEARNGNVPEAMKMLQDHEKWKAGVLPVDLTRDGLQEVLRLKAVAEIDLSGDGGDSSHPPTVYVNFSKLQGSESISTDDVCKAFIIFTEMMLGRCKDPRNPKTCQFIDLSGVTISSGFRVDMVRKIYEVFEPNYPETLGKMVMYPVSTMLGTTARTLLNFVNEKTQKKFVFTSDLSVVCEELGWDQEEVEACGGVTEFMHKHENAGSGMILE